MIPKALPLLFFLTCLGWAHGMDKLRVGLYLGVNRDLSAATTPAPEKLAPRLREVFGFRHYELLKDEEVNLRSNWEHWILSRKDFFMRIEELPHAAGDPSRIDYEIYQNGFLIAKGKYEPNPDTPLFINGPDFHQGRLIFVIEAR